jgi:predicted ATPase
VIPSGQQPEVVLLDYLRERELLLVLDNLEQLLSAQGDQIGALLAQVLREAPNVYLLVTSRERLRLQAEWVVELHGLGLPVDDRLESITRSDSVLLFVERARRTDGDFLLTTHNQAIVAQICRRLDGLPLALELAAAQVSFLPPALLLARLDQALPLLEGGPRDVPERQRTMRAAISWSHNLLDARERLVFERLAVFAGGFDLEAVEAVVAGGPILQSQVLGVVRRLVDQSLVVREGSHGDHARYRLLEPVRQYALECLENQPEEASVIRRRHAAYFVALAETANSFMRGPEQVHWIERLTDEYPNLCATMTWLLAQKDLTTAAHFGYMLWLFLWMRNHLGEGLRWTEQVLSHLPNSPSIARGEALLTTCVLLYGQANYARAMPLAEECLEQYRILDDPIGIALGVTMVGLTAAGLGLYEKATQFIEKGVALHLAVGDTWSAAMALSYWAPIVLSQGQYCRAAALAEQALQLARTRGDRIGAYSAHYNLALVAQAEDNTSSAQEHFCEALALAVEMGDEGNIASCLKGLGSLAASGGEHVYAAQLWGAAETLLDTHGAAVYAYTLDRALYERMLSTARACTDPRVWDAAWAKGRAMPLGEAVAIAQHIDVSADALSVWK